jgi:hypothetical protein
MAEDIEQVDKPAVIFVDFRDIDAQCFVPH